MMIFGRSPLVLTYLNRLTMFPAFEKVRERHLLALFVGISLLLAGLYPELGSSHFAFLVILFAILVIPDSAGFAKLFYWSKLNTKNTPWLWAFSAPLLICSPFALSLIYDWQSEFPFGGDHISIVGQAYRVGLFWLLPFGSDVSNSGLAGTSFLSLIYLDSVVTSRLFIIALGLAVILSIFHKRKRTALTILFIGLFSFSFVDHSDIYRWPTLPYLISLPWNGLAVLLDWDNLGNGIRVSNLAGMFLWFYLIRPVFVGKNTGVFAVCFSVLFFWSPPVVAIFSSTYSEPWALLCSLTALEIAITHKRKGLASALVFAGIATLCKETALLIIPLVWILASGIWAPRRGAPKYHLKEKLIIFKDELILFCAASAPLMIFVMIRTQIGAEIAGNVAGQSIRSWWFSLENFGTKKQLDLFYSDLSAVFSDSSWVFFFCLVLCWVALLFFRSTRLTSLVFLLFSISYIVFFALDGTNSFLVGYPRFIVWPLLLVCVPVLVLNRCQYNRIRSVSPTLVALGLASVAVMAQAPTLASHFSYVTKPDWLRNSSFYRYDPIYLPYKALLNQVPEEMLTRLRVDSNTPDPFIQKVRYSWPERLINFDSATDWSCACISKDDIKLWAAVLPPVESNPFFGSHLRNRERLENWGKNILRGPECTATMRSTCEHVYSVNSGSVTIGLLGVPYPND